VPRKDVHIFAPSIDADKIMQEQTIKPVEWTENSRDSLLQSAELIRKRKEEGRKKEIANKRK
jgi:tRNA A37 threonylcarbamoyladenosine biosynthesis protein TsaE